MGRVTGIGGVFLKAADPEKLRAWYATHLGLSLEAWGGVVFQWKDGESPDGGRTIFSFFPSNTTYFEPSKAPYMINFRVDDLESLCATLARDGIAVDPKRQVDENGKFAWLQDPEGNRIELWEPPRRA